MDAGVPGQASSDGRVRRRVRPDAVEHYELAVAEGRRYVDDQMAQLSAIRQRATQYLAFVGSATAFLLGTALSTAARAVPDLKFHVVAVGGSVLAFVWLILLVSILLDWRRAWWPFAGTLKWRFRLNSGTLAYGANPEVGRPSAAAFYDAVAYKYEEMADHNGPLLRRVTGRYATFLVLGIVQISVWGALVWNYR